MTMLLGAQIGAVLKGLEVLGAEPSKATAQAIIDRGKIRAAAAELTTDYQTLVEVWVGSVVDGSDPMDDPAYRSAVLADALTSSGNLGRVAGKVADERIAAAITDDRERILGLLKAATDAAGATLTAAHEVIRGPLTDEGAVFAKGGSAVDTHAGATRAVRLIEQLGQTWTALAHLTGFAKPETAWAERLVDLKDEHRRQFVRHQDQVTVWDLTREGYTIDLAIDRTTLKQRQESRVESRKRESLRAAEELKGPNYFGTGRTAVVQP